MNASRSCEWLEPLGKVGQGRKSSSPGEKFQVLQVIYLPLPYLRQQMVMEVGKGRLGEDPSPGEDR